jgi:UTP--glucose-1-phosphate uridylyltransferase
MITIVDRPLIQYAVDEAREAGIEELIFVTGRGKSALVDYFDQAFELEAMLREKGKSLEVLSPSNAKFGEVVTVRQQQPLGLGHAVWCARRIVGDEPFAVLLPDELMIGKPGCLAQMVEAYEKVGGNIVAALEVPDSETHKYGVIDPGATNGRLTEIRGMVEKPAQGTAPSNLMLPGRYILQPEVMRALDSREKGAGGEIQLTDAIAKLIGEQALNAYCFDGERYDCGSAVGFVIANLAVAQRRDDVGPSLLEFLDRAYGSSSTSQ